MDARADDRRLRVTVRVDVPETEADTWIKQQQAEMRSSLPRLVTTAEKAATEL